MMTLLLTSAFWIGLLKIIWVNILLSGDNAVVIALAARSLPEEQRHKAVVWGSGAAIAMRVVLTLFAVQLLQLPWLKMLGALLLLWIGIQLLLDDDGEENVEDAKTPLQAIKIILVADLVMSLDNVLAVAAAAEAAPVEARLPLLVFGLALSIPIVIFGSNLLLKVMDRLPWIITVGAMLIGWIAGKLMGSRGGLIRNLILGVVGSAVGNWLAGTIGIAATGSVGAILIGVGGACVVILVARWLFH